MPNQFNVALHNCAMECALHRLKKTCKAQFGSKTCFNCKFNIAAYTDADPRHIQLFMMEAERDVAIRVHEIKHQNSMAAAPVLVGLAFVALLLFLLIKDDRKLLRESKQQSSPTSVLQQSDLVWDAQAKIAEQMRKKVDVNGDGLTNCIDAAVLFYQYYPDKSKVTIELNYNPSTGMNHLFNCIYVNGAWRAIEPQAFRDGYKSYWMADVWGRRYDKAYNEDETERWKVYAK